MKTAFKQPIAIVGIGGIFPDALTLEQFWKNIKQGHSASREVPAGRWPLNFKDVFEPLRSPDKVYSTDGCYIQDFRLDYTGLNLDSSFIDELDPVFHIALYAAQQAIRDTNTDNINLRRAGVIIGNIALPTDKSSALTAESLGRWFEENIPGVSPSISSTTHPINRYVFGMVSGVLAQALGLGSGSYAIDAACASSLYALKFAVDELCASRTDLMLTGGVSRPDCLYTQMGFCQLNALSPTGICAPFDAKGDGLVVGEGAGIFALKRLDDAIRDQDHIYAVIRGIGLSNDRQGALLAPDCEGQLRAMRAAYEQSGWSPHDLDLVECHATGTPVGDVVEFTSLKTLWGTSGWQPGQCVIGSVKSNIGHLLTGAGAAGLIKVLLALKNRTLPPTANFSATGPRVELQQSPFQVLTEATPWERRDQHTPRRAGVNAFGFGGINAHVLLEEWIPSKAHQSSIDNNKSRESIAVVGMETHFGPWDSLRKFQERVLGDDEPVEPAFRGNWWGIEKSEWFKQAGFGDVPFKGFFINKLSVPLGKFRIPPKELEETLPQQLLVLRAAGGALDDVHSAACMSKEQLDELMLRTGVFIGMGLDLNTTNFSFRWLILQKAKKWADELGLRLTEDEFNEWVQSLRDSFGPPLTANRTVGALGGIVASRIAREFHIGGPSFGLSSEEGSGLQALETAVRALRQGDIEQAVVGAVDLHGDARSILNGHAIHPFSTSGKISPFDPDADGSIPGEGAAAVVLKRFTDALRDGDRIYALIKGSGTASGPSIDTYSPGENTYKNALDAAYCDADVDPVTVGYIETHGSGIPYEDQMEAAALTDYFGTVRQEGNPACAIGSVKTDIGHTGAAAGLASFVKTCLCLYQEIIPPVRNVKKSETSHLAGESFYFPTGAQYWLRNRASGPRRAGVSSCSVDGNCTHVVLEAYEPRERPLQNKFCTPYSSHDRLQPTGARKEALFPVEADDQAGLIARLQQLYTHVEQTEITQIESLARAWWHQQGTNPGHTFGVALIARSRTELLDQINAVRQALTNGTTPAFPGNRIFYSNNPVGTTGKVAFVFPGSGNHYPGMGRDISAQWPEILRQQDAQNQYLCRQYVPEMLWNEVSLEKINQHPRDLILGQVTYGTMMTDLLRSFGIQPQAIIGYSLGESTGLFALRAWTERDEMVQRMLASPLFTNDLAGADLAARQVWNLNDDEAVDWMIAAVQCPAATINTALKDRERVYLLIINTPDNCVIGGSRRAVMAVIEQLCCHYQPLYGVSTAHCEVLQQVAAPYRRLHLFNTTTAPIGIKFYSGAWQRSYEITPDSAADAILAQASTTIDFPAVIEQAYRDGVRIFIEIGPGTTCTRMIAEILAGRAHAARSACTTAYENVSTILRLLGMLIAERVPLDLTQLYGQETQVSVHQIQAADPKVRILDILTGGKPFHITIPRPHHRESTEKPVTPNVPHASPLAKPDSLHITTLIKQISATQTSNARAHEAYLSFSQGITESFSKQAAFRMTLIEAAMKCGSRIRKSDLNPGINARAKSSSRLKPAIQGALASLSFKPGALAPGSKSTVLPQEEQRERHTEEKPVFLNRQQCLEFAVGSIANVLGAEYAEVDLHPTRVRLPDEPLMLVDRIISVEGEPCSLTHGTVVTEHDIRPDDWYLDCGRIPTCIAVESGQTDLFLSGYLGIDFITKGLAVYRLLDAVVTFHDSMPGPGAAIRYEINIEEFFRQGETYLFHFNFEGTVDGQPLLSMRNGCAGFFTQRELDAGQGIIFTKMDSQPMPGHKPDDWQDLVPMRVESYTDEQINALRAGNLTACFGSLFDGLPLWNPPCLPGGRMHLIDRVLSLDPVGGRYGLGQIRAEADIHPDDWFLTCHFVDDQVMPGTLMYECSLHTLRVLLMRMGWIGEQDEIAWEPVPGIPGQLECRGQVIATTKKVVYEISIKELGFRPEPYAIADALMYADNKPIVRMLNMSLQLSGVTRGKLERIWKNHQQEKVSRYVRKPAIFDHERILAFAIGKPSEAFGESYKIFDSERIIARLPGPPYQFLDRITGLHGEQWQMTAGKLIEAQYDVPPEEWYFAANRQQYMPFSVLLEIALQPCGWLAAYAGSALTSDTDLSFRNLGGNATQFLPVTPDIGTLTTVVKLTNVSNSGGMIIQHYDFTVTNSAGNCVYQGNTYFGFFSKQALAHQVGLRDADPYQPKPAEETRAESFPYPQDAPFPDSQLRMIDQITIFVPDGGPHGFGFIRGIKTIIPDEWFFKAHFYQDPVWPGSLGLESFLQLLKVVAVKRWGWQPKDSFEIMALQQSHQWTYRGQVVPTDHEVTVQAVITAIDDTRRFLEAQGFLIVDGRIIYKMDKFTLKTRRMEH